MAVLSTISHPPLFPGFMDSYKLQRNHGSILVSRKGRFFRNPSSSKLVVFASGGETNGNGKIKEEEEEEAGDFSGELKRDRRSAFNLRWRDLLNPDPENILAVGLTGLLTWASVQVLWQLLFISFAIVLAALKTFLRSALALRKIKVHRYSHSKEEVELSSLKILRKEKAVAQS